MSDKTPSGPGRLALLYATDGALLGLFMISVGLFGSLLFAPASPVDDLIPAVLPRRALMGLAMGMTAITLVYSPLGARSGAHMNPAVTLAYLRLGRIRPGHAAGYIAAQFIFGLLGIALASAIIGPWFTGDPVHYAPTVPGPWGPFAAFAAEAAMAFVLMMTLLYVSNTKRLAAKTPLFAGLLVAVYITFEAPISGMSLNPARSLASAVPSGRLESLWVYFTAPVLGMVAAAEAFTRLPHMPAVHCCKLNHLGREVCVHCGCDGPIDFDAHPKSQGPSPAPPPNPDGDPQR